MDQKIHPSFLRKGPSETSKGSPRPPPFDVVYGWVNGSDPAWQSSWEYYAERNEVFLAHGIDSSQVAANSAFRWRDGEELRHSVRAVYQYGQAVAKKIYIMTADLPEDIVLSHMEKQQDNTTDSDGEKKLPSVHLDRQQPVGPSTGEAPPMDPERGQVPYWLDRSAETRAQVQVIHHSEFFMDKAGLPTFSSGAIESQLHHIPDLSDIVSD